MNLSLSWLQTVGRGARHGDGALLGVLEAAGAEQVDGGAVPLADIKPDLARIVSLVAEPVDRLELVALRPGAGDRAVQVDRLDRDADLAHVGQPLALVAILADIE